MSDSQAHGPVCVLGAGNMGGQIAHQAALFGFTVRLCSRSEERLTGAREESSKLLRRRVEKGRLGADECEAALGRVETTTDFREAVRGAAVIIESVAEDRDAKRELFQRISDHADDDAIVGTNSSTLPSSLFEDCVRRPERLLNIHFFNPALVMQLVEVVRGPHTSAETVEQAMDFARAIGKTPISVRKETYGFLANRMLFIALQEAFHLVEGGYVTIEDCDLAVRKALGWPMGPFELADLVGLDVVEAILAEGARQTGDPRWEAPATLREHVARGQLGRKSGEGFRSYPVA
jgi:3-hydroxybutyryl-CoA dehydrogenase